VSVRFVDLQYAVGLVVPDLPLEETVLLRSEAIMHSIELVHPHSHCSYTAPQNLLYFSIVVLLSSS